MINAEREGRLKVIVKVCANIQGRLHADYGTAGTPTLKAFLAAIITTQENVLKGWLEVRGMD
jgi:hypothetical protein